MTLNKNVLKWVDEAQSMLRPDKVVWVDGSREQLGSLRAEAISSGELVQLNQELLPGCVLHRSDVNDVARVEQRTYICSHKKEDAGPTNNWEDPQIMYAKMRGLFAGAMKGRTMYVIPYSMGPIGSPYSKVGVEVTDSIYVVLNMDIMTHIGDQAWEQLGDSDDWVRCIHSKGTLEVESRYICHFPEDNAIWSVNSGYGGNALLAKKCFALRMASFQGKKEGWLAEHMLILGIEDPHGKVSYIAGAFPSACGKTNLAMLIPPEIYKDKGYKVWCVGDDIAWLNIGEDGRLWAINPETGFFGVATGTGMKSNPNAVLATKKNTIFTNTVLNLDNYTAWWEGMDNEPPENALDWRGRPWNDRTFMEKGAHPNSRFTIPAENCPCVSPEVSNPQGVPIDAIVFGGRRAKTAPLVYEARDWQHGVFVGSTMASETTAAMVGVTGVLRRDPMAMLPFCGYHMGDYFSHWLEMGKELGDKAPKIFHVNWFSLDNNGHFIWPGFGENMRVIMWILNRCNGSAAANEVPIGYVPNAEDINIEGIDITIDTIKGLLDINKDHWQEDVQNIKSFYTMFGDKLPSELLSELAKLEKNLE